MVIIKNNPELSKAFRNEEVQLFLKDLLNELDNPHVLKQFLIDGVDKTFNDQMEQLSNSFEPITTDYNDKRNGDCAYLEVERCIDGVRFKVGDKVIDKIDPEKRVLPIGRLYSDSRGLHIRLDIAEEKAITWRELSRIEQTQTTIDHPPINIRWWIEEGKPIVFKGMVHDTHSIMDVGNGLHQLILTNRRDTRRIRFTVDVHLSDILPHVE